MTGARVSPVTALRGASLRYDIFAGFTLAAIAIPEQMATARLAGFPPHIGFIAFIAGSLAFAIFGSSRFVSVGADSTIAPIFAGALAMVAATGTPHYINLAQLLALLVGSALIVGGLLRAGWIADLLSIPVLTGFLAGISVHIALSQAPAFFGLAPGHGGPLARLAALAHGISHAHPATTTISVGCLVVIVVSEKISARIPGALIALAAAALTVEYFNLRSIGVAVLGQIAHNTPRLSVPPIGVADVTQIFGLAAVVAFVVMVQTAATSRAFPAQGAPSDIARDFLGVGAGSVVAGLFGAFAVNASPPRTAIIVESGGASQFSGLVAAAVITAIMLYGGGALAHVPTAALAAVLMFVAGRIFRVRDMIDILRKTRAEFVLVVATILAVVLLPLQTGVALAIVLSLVHGIWTATRTRMIEFDRIPGTTVWWPEYAALKGERLPGVLVVAFQAPLSFLNADMFQRDLETAIERSGDAPRLVVLEASSVVEIDYSAARALREAIRACRARGVDFAVARLESVRAQKAFEKFGVMATLGPERVFHSVHDATCALTPKTVAVEEKLKTDSAVTPPSASV